MGGGAISFPYTAFGMKKLPSYEASQVIFASSSTFKLNKYSMGVEWGKGLVLL